MELALDGTLAAAAEGDEQAWKRLVDAYSGRLYGLIFRQCGNAELAEEITQGTFVKVVKKLGDYEDSGRFESWLFRIAINRLRDEMRRRKRQASTMDFSETPPETVGYQGEDQSPDAPVMQAERFAELHAAIAKLPEADRELLHLRYTSQMSFQQIADTLEQPLGTVLARGHRALKKLKALMTDNADAA